MQGRSIRSETRGGRAFCVSIVPEVNPPLVWALRGRAVWEHSVGAQCGSTACRAAEFKNARSFSGARSQRLLVRRSVSAGTWRAFLPDHSWWHFWHDGASADSKFKQQRAGHPGWTSLVAWPVDRRLRFPEGSGKVLALDLGPGGWKRILANVCLFPRPPAQFTLARTPACAIQKPLRQLQAGSREKHPVLGEEHRIWSHVTQTPVPDLPQPMCPALGKSLNCAKPQFSLPTNGIITT